MEDNDELYCPHCGEALEFEQIVCYCSLCIAIGGKCMCSQCQLKDECDSKDNECKRGIK
jgi:hypothetical protein